MYLVGIEERRMFGEEFRIVPRELPVFSHFAIAVAPVATAPVGCNIRYTCMADGCGEDVSARLEILRHKTSVAGSHTSHLRGIYEGMLFAEPLYALDDVVATLVAPSTNMASGKLLAESRGSRWFQHEHHIAHRRDGCQGVGVALQTRCRGAAAIVIDNHGIVGIGFEIWREEIETFYFITARSLEGPFRAGGNLNIGVELLPLEFAEGFAVGASSLLYAVNLLPAYKCRAIRCAVFVCLEFGIEHGRISRHAFRARLSGEDAAWGAGVATDSR